MNSPIVQGPLALNWMRRKWGGPRRVENSDLTEANPPRSSGLRLWMNCSIVVEGRPNWLFVKLHTHGASRRIPERCWANRGAPFTACSRRWRPRPDDPFSLRLGSGIGEYPPRRRGRAFGRSGSIPRLPLPAHRRRVRAARVKLLFVSNLFPDEGEPDRGLDNATLLHQLARRAEIRVLALRPTLPLAARVWTPRAVDRAFDPLIVPALYVPKAGSLFNHRLAARALREPFANCTSASPSTWCSAPGFIPIAVRFRSFRGTRLSLGGDRPGLRCCRASARFILEVHVGQRLAVAIPDDDTGVVLFGGPWRQKAVGHDGLGWQTAANATGLLRLGSEFGPNRYGVLPVAVLHSDMRHTNVSAYCRLRTLRGQAAAGFARSSSPAGSP